MNPAQPFPSKISLNFLGWKKASGGKAMKMKSDQLMLNPQVNQVEERILSLSLSLSLSMSLYLYVSSQLSFAMWMFEIALGDKCNQLRIYWKLLNNRNCSTNNHHKRSTMLLLFCSNVELPFYLIVLFIYLFKTIANGIFFTKIKW